MTSLQFFGGILILVGILLFLLGYNLVGKNGGGVIAGLFGMLSVACAAIGMVFFLGRG